MPEAKDVMSREVIATCGKCLLPIHPGEIGLRHFGMYTAHSEHRCIELLLAQLTAALEAQRKAEEELKRMKGAQK